MESTLLQHIVNLFFVAYGLSIITAYSKEMSESLYVAAVSPLHKIRFKPYNQIFSKRIRIYWMLEKSKPGGIANLLPKLFLIIFSCVAAVITVPATFFAPTRVFKSFTCRLYSLKQLFRKLLSTQVKFL